MRYDLSKFIFILLGCRFRQLTKNSLYSFFAGKDASEPAILSQTVIVWTLESRIIRTALLPVEGEAHTHLGVHHLQHPVFGDIGFENFCISRF